jgi:uncharacterized membrane protein YkgB
MATLTVTGHRAESVFDRLGTHGDAISKAGSWASTTALVIIFLWFGSMKFIPFEAEGLQPIISNNPLISWLYTLFGVLGGAKFLGVFEIATGLLIAGRLVNPKLSALGGAMGAWSFVLTVSCLFTTPGVIQPGSVIGLGAIGSFLVKDIVLFSACLWTLGVSLAEIRSRARA